MATTKKPTKDASTVKSIEDLKAELQAKRQDLTEARRSHAAGELVNPKALKSYRKDIARLLTEINQKGSK
ncbi:50S ribosomal protein L29 [Candidatus Saccharibacteria bacterium]|nr:MAG: 50S ribosomal protein L29 [Candidatus Saccharibacteria bacterium]